MKRLIRWTALANAFGFLALAGVARGDEETIPVKELPKAVIKAVKAKFPEAKLKEASKEEEDGKTVYEVSLKNDGRAIDVVLTSSGAFLEIEKELSLDEVPAAVKKTLAAKYPHARIHKIEQVTKGDNPPYYEAVVTTEVILSAHGQIIGAAAGAEGEEKSSAKKSKKEDDDDEKEVKGKKSKKHDDRDDDDDDEKEVKGKKSKKHDDRDDDDDDEKEVKGKKSKKHDED